MSQPNLFLFKSLLLEYTQKQRLHKPVYESLKKGPGHEPIFTASVIVKGQKYDSPPSSCSRNVKAAEHAAARVALEELCKEEGNSSAGNYPSAVLESGLCKNLLQEQLKQLNLPNPYYSWKQSGEGGKSTYEATVEIAGTHYVGDPAKNKKVAAIKAARIAVLAIQGQRCKSNTEHVDAHSSNTEHVDAHSGMKREREVEQPSGGQKDEMNKRRNAENASAIDVKHEQSHLQQEMSVDDGQEKKTVAGLSFQKIGQKSEGEEMVQRTEKQAQQSTGISQPNNFLFKSQLMEFTQKQRLHKPVYESVNKGAVHEPIFAATVIVNGHKYDSPPSSCSRTVKAAEHAAARVALEELCKEEGNAWAGNYPSAVLDSGLCKTLLREQLKKLHLPDPYYSWKQSGEGGKSTYEATVQIAGTRYVGGAAKNKKVAAIKAARTALLAIQGEHCKSNAEHVDAHSGMKREREVEQPSGGQKDEMSKRRNAENASAIDVKDAHSSNTEHVDAHSGMKREREVEQPSGGQKDGMNKRRNAENASAIDVKDEQSHLQQQMCADDGQEIKPVAGLNYQETAQKSEDEEMVQRTEQQAKQSRGYSCA